VLASDLDHVAVSPKLLRQAVVPSVAFDRIDQTVGQSAAPSQDITYLFPGCREILPGAGFTGPASRKAVAEHRLVGFGPGESYLVPLTTVLMANVANHGDGAVPVTNDLRHSAAPAVDEDGAVRYALVHPGAPLAA
jgi:hypothetical protein